MWIQTKSKYEMVNIFKRLLYRRISHVMTYVYYNWIDNYELNLFVMLFICWIDNYEPNLFVMLFILV